MADDGGKSAAGRAQKRKRPARSQEERRATAESRLIEAAVGLIAERGIERFTMAEVGVAAGYSGGLPAHYFGTKQNLILETARHMDAQYISRRTQDIGAPEGLEGLLEAVGYYFDSAERSPDVSRALANINGGMVLYPDIARGVNETDRSGDALEPLLRAGIEHGSIRSDIDPVVDAALIRAGMRAAVAIWLANRGQYEMSTIRDAFVAAVRRSLSP